MTLAGLSLTQLITDLENPVSSMMNKLHGQPNSYDKKLAFFPPPDPTA